MFSGLGREEMRNSLIAKIITVVVHSGKEMGVTKHKLNCPPQLQQPQSKFSHVLWRSELSCLQPRSGALHHSLVPLSAWHDPANFPLIGIFRDAPSLSTFSVLPSLRPT
jgi:hypothetical protein